MSQIIGRFEPFMSCHKAFDVASMEPSDSMGDPGYIGKKVDGSSFHVFNKHWKWIPLWTGEGLPPVGMVCECHLPGELTNNYSWVEAKVIWHDGPTECAVIRSTSRLAWCDEFRPIRTPEQIAAEDKSRAINHMMQGLEPFEKMSPIAVCELLYDAGYRKFEIVENEE